MSLLTCTSCRFAEHMQTAIFQDLTNETLLRAFVEGNDHPAYLHPNKTSLLLEGLRTGKMSSNASFYLGPLYWAYRKCFWPALALSSIYVACFVLCLCLLDQPLTSFLPMIAFLAFSL